MQWYDILGLSEEEAEKYLEEAEQDRLSARNEFILGEGYGEVDFSKKHRKYSTKSNRYLSKERDYSRYEHLEKAFSLNTNKQMRDLIKKYEEGGSRSPHLLKEIEKYKKIRAELYDNYMLQEGIVEPGWLESIGDYVSDVVSTTAEGVGNIVEQTAGIVEAGTPPLSVIEAAIPGVEEGDIEEQLDDMVEAAKDTNPALGGLAVLSAEALKSKGNPYQTILKILAGTTAAKTISDETGFTDLITEKLEDVESQDVLNILREAVRTVVPGLDTYLDLEDRYKDRGEPKPEPQPKDVEEQFDEAAAGFADFWPIGSGPDPDKPDKDKVPYKERTFVERAKTRLLNGLKRSLAFHTTNLETGATLKVADTIRAAIPVIQSMYTYNELFQVLGIYDKIEKTDAGFFAKSADLLETFAFITDNLVGQLGEEYEPLQKYRGIFGPDEGGEQKDQDTYEKERKTTREEFGF